MVIRVVIDYGKLALKKWSGIKWGGLRAMGVSGFCGFCLCLGIYLLL
jgi:hypothetical protein